MDTSAINSQTNKRFFRQITIDKGRRNRLDSRKRNERKEKEESKKTDQFNLLHIRSTSTVIIQPKWRLPRRRYIIIIIRQSTYRIRKRRFELSWFIITHQIKPLKIRIYVYEYIYIYKWADNDDNIGNETRPKRKTLTTKKFFSLPRAAATKFWWK